jgi:uridylate kinase
MLEYSWRKMRFMRVVLRIGGSVVASPIDPALIARYAQLLKDLKKEGHDVAVVVGGGNLAREFIRTARDLGLREESQDRIAISVSRLFALLFIEKLGCAGCKNVPVTIEEAAECLQKGSIPVMGGLRPGMTTDAVAALIAEAVKADLLVKGTDQDGIYDKDPRKHADAIKLQHLTFKDLSRLFSGSRHKAGIHQIIDPEAVGILTRARVSVAVVNGFRPENVLKAIRGKCEGTLID